MTITALPPVADRPVRVTDVAPGRRRGAWVTMALAYVFLVVSTAVGAGLGLRHLTKSGMTGMAVLGLTLLAVGLVSIGVAAVAAWRDLRGWRRLWLAPLALVTLFVMLPVAEGTMLAVAPRAALGSVTPSDRGLAYQSVTFRTTDGVRLAAWYLPSVNHAAVVTVPGAGSTRSATLGQAAVLARHGYGVLMIDPRGQGRSGGRAMDAGWYGDRDVTAAVRFLQARPDVDATRIGVLGLSMGGEEAIGAAAVDPAIRAVVAEGATHRTAADKAGYLPGGVAGAIQRGMDQLTYGTVALFTATSPPRTLHSAIARSTSTPFLLIAAGKGIDEPSAVAYLRAAAPDRVETWTVPGATHVHGLAAAPDEWAARVLAFLDKALGLP